jgi:hypothetical protein
MSYILSRFDVFGPEAKAVAQDIQGAAIGFDLSESYSYVILTESEAARFALRALKLKVTDFPYWSLDPKFDGGPDVFLWRVNQYEGRIVFRHSKDRRAVIYVDVKLDPKNNHVVCIVKN